MFWWYGYYICRMFYKSLKVEIKECRGIKNYIKDDNNICLEYGCFLM